MKDFFCVCVWNNSIHFFLFFQKWFLFRLVWSCKVGPSHFHCFISLLHGWRPCISTVASLSFTSFLDILAHKDFVFKLFCRITTFWKGSRGAGSTLFLLSSGGTVPVLGEPARLPSLTPKTLTLSQGLILTLQGKFWEVMLLSGHVINDWEELWPPSVVIFPRTFVVSSHSGEVIVWGFILVKSERGCIIFFPKWTFGDFSKDLEVLAFERPSDW